MNFELIGVLYVTGLGLGMLVLLEVGRRIALRRRALGGDGGGAGFGVVEGAVFGLMGLMVAFTFSGAASRFDIRRNQIVEEANNIGTAWLRLDLLPDSAQPALRDKFRQYLDARLATYRAVPDLVKVAEEYRRATELQGQIWSLAVAAGSDPSARPFANSLLLPALNAMFDITTTRRMATLFHPPLIIYMMLAALALVCALMSGYGMASSSQRSWLHIAGFAVIMSTTVYVILDLEYPRLGLIRLEEFDQVLVDVRSSMN